MQLNTLSMVHEFLRRTVKPGDFCIDATAGKGRDTALLCRLTGDAGRVLAPLTFRRRRWRRPRPCWRRRA